MKLHTKPLEIMGLPDQPDSYVEVDLDDEWVIGADRPFFTKANWSPFSGMKVKGSVQRVVLNGKVAFVDGVVS
jgi:carbamoyl-phosphate synthase/aspartate carbamoyltransferase/dihydroorotase